LVTFGLEPDEIPPTKSSGVTNVSKKMANSPRTSCATVAVHSALVLTTHKRQNTGLGRKLRVLRMCASGVLKISANRPSLPGEKGETARPPAGTAAALQHHRCGGGRPVGGVRGRHCPAGQRRRPSGKGSGGPGSKTARAGRRARLGPPSPVEGRRRGVRVRACSAAVREAQPRPSGAGWAAALAALAARGAARPGRRGAAMPEPRLGWAGAARRARAVTDRATRRCGGTRGVGGRASPGRRC
jgi:hypothetical protein